MPAEQLATDVFKVGGQPTLGGALENKYEVIEARYGFEEDSEIKQRQTGLFASDITYSRRETCQLDLEALDDAGDGPELIKSGELASGILKRADGITDTAWNIQPGSTCTKTRGVEALSLSLIMQTDTLT